MSVNKVQIVGRLGADPEMMTLEGGTVLAKISVGTNKVWTDRNNERQEETSWHNITMFGKLGENAGRILQKGSLVFVEGELRYRTVDKDGEKRRYTDINARDFRILADGRKNDSNENQNSAPQQQSAPQQSAPQQPAPQQNQSAPQPATSTVGNTDDDLPF
jgi:single-strand DNA-binding protein